MKGVIYDMTAEPVHLKGVVGRQWRVTLNVAGDTWQHYDWEAQVRHVPTEAEDPLVTFVITPTVIADPAGVDLVLLADAATTAQVPAGEYFWDLVYTGKTGSPQDGIGPASLLGGRVTVEEGPTQ